MTKQVKLVRRWGANEEGSTVNVDDIQAAWLIGNSFGEDPKSPGTATAGARAPGTDGADPRAGGDVSRGGGMQIVRGGRHDGDALPSGEQNYKNRAAPASGSPRQGGANAPDPKAASGASDESPAGKKPSSKDK